MSIPPHRITVAITGKVTIGTDPLTGEAQTFVYQKTRRGAGNCEAHGRTDLQLRRHVEKLDPKTPAQRLQRNRLAAATAAWHALTEPERQHYRDRAKPLHMTGFNLFVKEHMKWRG